MPSFLTPPGGAEQLVRSWIEHPALRRLVEADGGTWPDGDLPKVIDALVDFSTVWDRRNGESRLIFKEGDESRTDERGRLIYHAVEQLGLLNPAPPATSNPDYLLILGGLATGVEPRVRYAADLLASGRVRTAHVAALASFREIYPKEQAAAERYAPSAQFEIDLFTAILGQAFPGGGEWEAELSGDPVQQPRLAEARRIRPGEPKLSTYASRSLRPESRIANTADTYIQFANDVGIGDGSHILIITSTIYRPFQHMDAVRVLGTLGATVETAGVPPAGSAISHPPSAFLQEVRSTIRAGHMLLDTCS